MSLKFLIIIFTAFFMSGCATSLKKEVHGLEYDLQRSNSLVYKAKSSLIENSDVYDGQSCVEPKRGPKPKFSCYTAQQAQETALVSCAVEYKGCDVVVSLFSNSLDGASKRFLESQACEAMLAKMQGGELDPGKVVIDGALAIAKNSCENEGLLSGFGCLVAFGGEAAKFINFVSCVDKQSTTCLENYQNWKDGPTRRKAECESNLATISSETNNIDFTSRLLREKKATLMWKLFGN